MAVGDREFGVLSERVENVQRDVGELRHEMKQNSAATAEILKRIAGLDGGWRVLIAISAIVSAGVGILLKFLPALGLHL